jgi:hypothetical protein
MSGWFKPPAYFKEYEELPLKYQKIIRWFDIAVLGILVALFVYPYTVKKTRTG